MIRQTTQIRTHKTGHRIIVKVVKKSLNSSFFSSITLKYRRQLSFFSLEFIANVLVIISSARRRKRTKLIDDIEWAKSLKGLSIKVPDNWWNGCNNGRILHYGKIDSFDQYTQKWNLLLDSNDDDDLYLLAYMMLFVSTLTNNPLPFMNSNFHISLFMKMMMKLKKQMGQDIRQRRQQNGATSI